MRRTVALVVFVLLVVSSGVAAPVVAQQDDGTTDAAARNLTLEELAPGGSKPANAPDAVRQNGRYGEFVVKKLPTGLLVNEGENSPAWQYMSPGSTVSRDYVQLWSKRPYGADSQKYVVEVAHYTVGQESVQTENGVQQRRAAKNVETYSRTMTFNGGYDYSKIDLKSHFDNKVRTVMCAREPNEPSCLENPGDTRWTFYHSTSKATMPIETNSAGARLGWSMMMLLLPFFGSTVVTLYGGRKAVERAKAGPQVSAIWWVLVAVAGILFVVLAWDWLNATLIRAPYLVSMAGGILLGVIAVEWFGRTTFGAGFLQFKLEDGFDPTSPDEVKDALENGNADGEEDDSTDATGVIGARLHIARFARGDDGTRSAIRQGLRRFVARARGATADLEVDGNIQTKIDVDGPLDELYLLDPEDEEPLEYEPERHRIDFPDLVTYEETEDGETVRQIHPVPYIAGVAALGFSYLIGNVVAGTGLLGLLVGAVLVFTFKVLEPVEGRLKADLAPVHYNHAVATMLTHARGLADAKSWDDWFRNYAESEAESHADRKDLMDDRSDSQLEELFDRYVGKDTEEPTRDADSTETSADD